MGIFDRINKAMKNVEEERKANPENLQDGTAKTPVRTPHPGYSRITAWMKTRYQGKIAGISDPYQRTLELELIAAEATSGLSIKVQKGFLSYLKSQNYEQLLK